MKNVRSLSAVALATAIALCSSARAQAPQPQQGDVQLTGNEVLLDLTVTDKKGKPVTDLKPGEVEVYENGRKQDVTSFGIVRVGPAASGAAAPGETSSQTAVSSSPLSRYNLIVVLIDRTSVEQTDLAQVYKAAERFVNEKLASNDLVAVFASTNRLVMMQNFTSNKAALLDALKRATAGTSVPLQEATGNAARVQLVAAQGSDVNEKPIVADPNSDMPDRAFSEQLAQNAAGIDTAFANLRDQFQSLAVIDSLLTLTKVYSNIQGRKSIVLYSEGFVVTNDTDAPFKSMIAAANRGNFTVYAVNATGLSANVRTGTVMPRRGPDPMETDARMTVQGGESGLDRMVKPNLTDDDKSLARLAGETGGVLLRNTNDLGKGFDAISNDLRAYYAVSYSPANTELDGSYRTIEVRVSRKDVDVRTRKGYYAVPGGAEAVMLPFEPPVLALLANEAAKPSDLPLAFRTERFQTRGGWLVPLVLGVDGGALSPGPAKKEDPDGNFYEVDAVALVRDASQRVVAKLSRASYFRAPKDRLQDFQTSNLPLAQFGQQLVLAPGTYTIQTGVYDPASKKATVINRKVTLPPLPAADAPALSSIVLSRYTEPVAETDRAADSDPFVVDGKVRVVPSPNGKFKKAVDNSVIAYFKLHGPASTQYQMQMQFLLDDKVVGGTQPSPIATNADGVTVASSKIPLGAFAPGVYRLVLYILPTGSTKPVASATTSFQLE